MTQFFSARYHHAGPLPAYSSGAVSRPVSLVEERRVDPRSRHRVADHDEARVHPGEVAYAARVEGIPLAGPVEGRQITGLQVRRRMQPVRRAKPQRHQEETSRGEEQLAGAVTLNERRPSGIPRRRPRPPGGRRRAGPRHRVVELVAPARNLVDPVHLVVEHQPAERQHERDLRAIAVGHARPDVDDRLLAVLLGDPSARERDEPAAPVAGPRRKPADRLHERRLPRAAGRRVARAVEGLQLDGIALPLLGPERMRPVDEVLGGERLLPVELVGDQVDHALRVRRVDRDVDDLLDLDVPRDGQAVFRHGGLARIERAAAIVGRDGRMAAAEDLGVHGLAQRQRACFAAGQPGRPRRVGTLRAPPLLRDVGARDGQRHVESESGQCRPQARPSNDAKGMITPSRRSAARVNFWRSAPRTPAAASAASSSAAARRMPSAFAEPGSWRWPIPTILNSRRSAVTCRGLRGLSSGGRRGRRASRGNRSRAPRRGCPGSPRCRAA